MLTTDVLVRTQGGMAHSPWSQVRRGSLRDGVIEVIEYLDSANGDKSVLVEFTPSRSSQPSDRFTADLIWSVKDAGGFLNRALEVELLIDAQPITICFVAPSGRIKQILAVLRAAAPARRR